MTPPLPEREAQLFWPGDYLRHDGEVFLCREVRVSPSSVEIQADRFVNGRPTERRTLRFTPGQIVRAPTAATLNLKPADEGSPALLFA